MFADALSYPVRNGGWAMIVTGAIFSLLLNVASFAPMLGLAASVFGAAVSRRRRVILTAIGREAAEGVRVHEGLLIRGGVEKQVRDLAGKFRLEDLLPGLPAPLLLGGGFVGECAGGGGEGAFGVRHDGIGDAAAHGGRALGVGGRGGGFPPGESVVFRLKHKAMSH
jgi:hypothetical protein